MVKIFIYCRVSSKQQSEWNKGHISLDVQEAAIRRWCRSRGIDTRDLVIIHEVRSGASAYRQTKLRQVIDDADEGDMLVVYNMSRFSRNVLDGLVLIDTLKSNGVTFYSAMEDVAYDTSAHKHLIRMTLCMAQSESEQISERVRANIAFRRGRGDDIGNPAYGYDAIRQPNGARKFIRNTAEQAIIKKIVEWARRGKPAADIAAKLNNDRLKKRGKPWTSTGVRSVLRSQNVSSPRRQAKVVKTTTKKAAAVKRQERRKCIYSLRPVKH